MKDKMKKNVLNDENGIIRWMLNEKWNRGEWNEWGIWYCRMNAKWKMKWRLMKWMRNMISQDELKMKDEMNDENGIMGWMQNERWNRGG